MRLQQRIILFFVAAVGIGSLLEARALFKRTPVSRCNRAMIRAFAARRLVEARLSGDVSAGGYLVSTDGNPVADRTGVDEASLTDAYNEITEAVSSESASNKDDIETQHAFVRLLIADGKSREALPRMRKVVGLLPSSAEACNDMGVCLFALGRLDDALDKFDEALSYNPKAKEALFNRALCHQRLLLRSAAAREFSGLEKTEPDGGWLAEIRRRKEEVTRALKETPTREQVINDFHAAVLRNDATAERQIVEKNYDSIYNHGIGDLTFDCLKSQAGSEADNDRPAPWSEMELIGRLLSDVKGDRIVSDEYHYLSSLSAAEKQVELQLLGDYGIAVNTLRSVKGPDRLVAVEKLRALGLVFAKRGNYAISSEARTWVIYAEFDLNEFSAVMSDLKGLQALVDRFEWPDKRAWAYAQTANTLSRMGHDSPAVTYCERALDIYNRMREPAHSSKALQYLGIAYWRLGDLDKALEKLRGAILMLNESEPRLHLQDLGISYLNIADIYRLRGNHILALLFSEEALGYSRSAGDNRRVVQAASFVAVERARLDQYDQVEEALKTAREALQRMPRDKGASYSESLLLTRAGEVASRRGEADRALSLYSDAERAAREADDKRILLTLLRSRAEAYIRQGRKGEARAEISRAADEVAQYREGISDKQYRGSFLDLTHGVFDQLVSLNISEGLTKEAFDASESARALSLLDDLNLTNEGPLSLSQVQEWLPSNMILVEFSVTSEGTHIFVVKRDGFSATRSPITAERLDSLVDRYVSDLREKASLAALYPEARALYDHLIRPVAGFFSVVPPPTASSNDGTPQTRDSLDPDATICIVADKALNFLPFAALLDEADNYLIQSRRIVYAPSASVLVQCLKRDQKLKAAAPERMLSVGNPSFDRGLFPNLGMLDDSDREASRSARPYKDSLVLTEDRASEARVLDGMKNSSVVHIASHTVVQSGSPWLAAILLAPSDRSRAHSNEAGLEFESGTPNPDDGTLLLSEIYRLKLARTRLVVLSSCQSALGRYYRGEGVVSLVRPFIAAGVPQVVASLWAVDSRSTADLMIAFHESRTRTRIGPGDALRRAQLEMLGKEGLNHPYYWGGFIAVGAND